MIKMVREIVMFAACAMMFGSWCFLRPLYKSFGWKIFRVGGAKKEIREMYKTFQKYRALNLLDIQSSFMFFVLLFLYLRIGRFDYWAFFCMFLCDVQASRYMLKYLKREDMTGVAVSVISKLFVVSWWIVVLQDYVGCFNRYATSRKTTAPWFTPTNSSFGYAPDLNSVVASYAGTNCISPQTLHDSRTLEVLLINFGQAAVFRVGSIFVSVFVCRNFNRGLRDVFYVRPKEDKDRELINDSRDDDNEKKYGEYSDEEYDSKKKYSNEDPDE